MVQVTLGGENIEFGYSHFKFEGTSEKQGTLQMLLMSGQVNFWKNKEYVSGLGGLRAFRDENSVVVFMEKEEYLEKFQDERPRSVLFRTEGNMMNKKSIRVPVKYEVDEGEREVGAD